MEGFFLRRAFPEPAPAHQPATVTITGTGNSTYCYATIGGTKRYGAGTYEVMPGDTITFGVYGYSSTYYGRVTIDGTQALNVTNRATQTYNWTVPSGVKAISINMTYTSSTYQRNGRIVVTTTSGGGGSGGESGGITLTLTTNYEQDTWVFRALSKLLSDQLNPGTHSFKVGEKVYITMFESDTVKLNGTRLSANGTHKFDGDSSTWVYYEHTMQKNTTIDVNVNTSTWVTTVTITEE